MKCPKCHSTLIIVEKHNIQLDYCPHCKGIWFDEGEIEMLSEALPDVDFTAPNIGYLKMVNVGEEKRKCPRCSIIMEKVIMNQKPPVLDACPSGHGYWFDANELQEYVKNNTTRSNNAPITFLQEVLG